MICALCLCCTAGVILFFLISQCVVLRVESSRSLSSILRQELTKLPSHRTRDPSTSGSHVAGVQTCTTVPLGSLLLVSFACPPSDHPCADKALSCSAQHLHSETGSSRHSAPALQNGVVQGWACCCAQSGGAWLAVCSPHPPITLFTSAWE